MQQHSNQNCTNISPYNALLYLYANPCARLLALEMAHLIHHKSLIALAILISLLLLEAALAPATASAAEPPVKKIGMRIRQANKEDAQWLDRYAATYQTLGAGPFRMVRATPEQEHWLNRLSNDVGTTEDGGSGYMDFDDDNPYVDALRDWVSRLTKQSMGEAAQAENPFQDL